MARFLDFLTTLFQEYMHKGIILLILTFYFVICTQPFFSQDTIPTVRHQMDGEYVEIIKGNLPLIISVPHGGYEKPENIPERNGRFAKNQDIYTIEIVRKIISHTYELTGRYPHVIINHLHRTRLDANRSIKEAANGNPDAELVWEAYHNQISNAKSVLLKEYGKGLFIDLHGHRHEIERIELGYLLSAEELRLSDELLNDGYFNEFISIRNLLENNIPGLPVSEMIRGEFSLGGLIGDKGYLCVPDDNHPCPEPGEPYFSGGYNLTRYGSSGGGSIDGIQIEVGQMTRNDNQLMNKVGGDIARGLIEFLSIHYFPEMK